MYKLLLKTAVPDEAKRIRKENIKTIPPTNSALNRFGFKLITFELNYLQVFWISKALSNPHLGEKGVSGLKVAKSSIDLST